MGLSNQIPSSRIAQAGVIPNAAARPSSPYEGQMVYQQDTDAVLVWNGSAWYPNWNQAWGSVSLTTRTSNITIGGGTVILTAPAFNGIAGRLYKITHYQSVAYNTGAGYTIMQIINNNATVINESFMPNRAANEPSAFAQFYIGTMPTTSNVITVKGTSTNLTPTNNSVAAPCYLLIEDIGPA